MLNYEVTFIVDPVLSNDEIQGTSQNYVEHLQNEGCDIVNVDDMGLKQLAYPIKKRNSGHYYCIEFNSQRGDFIDKLELGLRRDTRIMRFLTVRLDKYGVKYNEDKRNGLIGKVTKKSNDTISERPSAPFKKSSPKAAAPAPAKAEAKPETKAEVKEEAKTEEE